MGKFDSLIFVPEGAILNEGVAERNALRQTLDEVASGFGPKQRIQYAELLSQIKFLTFSDRIELVLQTFCRHELYSARKIFYQKMKEQKQLVKDVGLFLGELSDMDDQIKLILCSKEDRETISSRLDESELLNCFSAVYTQDDFVQRLPNEEVLMTIVQEQNLDPATCLVIGTDLADDIQGAENAGLASLWIAPRNIKTPIHPNPTIHLTTLSDLLFYLELS